MGRASLGLASAVQSDSYASAFARLASGQVDVLVTMPMPAATMPSVGTPSSAVRLPSGRRPSVIGVTAPIYNDTISVSKNSEIMTDEFIAALQNAFINIGNTDAGKGSYRYLQPQWLSEGPTFRL